MGGRPPTVYREKTAAAVLDSIACGATLEAACAEHGLAKGTVAVWAARDFPPGFRQRYFAAFAAKMLAEADKILPIVDGVLESDSMARVNAAKNAADARRWLASRMLGEFSERVDHNVNLQGAVRIYIPENGRLYGAPVLEGSVTAQLEGPEQAEDG
jgi:hypothetical protein